MEEQTQEFDIEKEIESKKNEIKMLQNKKKLKRINENRKLRVRSNNNGSANMLIRVSNNFAKKVQTINDKREKNGFERLSGPKTTDLTIKHKSWPKIEQDIVGYNTELETGMDTEEFNK